MEQGTSDTRDTCVGGEASLRVSGDPGGQASGRGMDTIWVELILIVVSILVNGFFAGPRSRWCRRG